VLSIPGDSEVELLSKKLIPVHNNCIIIILRNLIVFITKLLLCLVFMGFVFGNNPASVICLHEMAFFPLMQGIFIQNPAATLAIQTELEFLLGYI
jgi:hypothetical protein